MARTRAADTLRHVGLFEERYRAIGGYSTGMKQRVKLGQALVHDPAFVFLDEPTAGLDPAGREEMLTLIRKTHREFGISVLFSSHLMADIERTCDRIIVLQGGRLVQSGEVTFEVALAAATRPSDFELQFRTLRRVTREVSSAKPDGEPVAAGAGAPSSAAPNRDSAPAGISTGFDTLF